MGEEDSWPDAIDAVEVNLCGVDLVQQDFTDVDLEGALLRRAKFRQTRLGRTNLNGADLRGATVFGLDERSDLGRIKMRNVRWCGAMLQSDYLLNEEFANQVLNNAHKPNDEASLKDVVIVPHPTRDSPPLPEPLLRELERRGARYLQRGTQEYEACLRRAWPAPAAA